MSDREDALLAKVEAAFSHVAYPGDDDLTDSSYGDEPKALIAEFRGKTDRRELSAEFLDQACGGSALSFFSDAGLHFYLPAYLMADIRGELSHVSPEVVLTWSFTAQSGGQRLAEAFGGGTMEEHARRCFDRFDARQVAVVIEYLRWKLERQGYDPCIAEALENYWLPRAPSLLTQERGS